MLRLKTLCTVVLIAGLGVAVGAGCARSPEAKKARHLERGDKFLARKDYKDAVIEYRNVLRIEPSNAVAIRNLGLAHYQAGELNDAFPFLHKAAELEPKNEDVRLKLATVYLVARRPDDARTHATKVLDQDAKNFDALMLLVDSATRPADVDAALSRFEQVQATFDERPTFHIGLGTLYLKKRDIARAEQAYKQAVARDPKSVHAHSALGRFYLLTRDSNRAEQELKAAAELSPAGSPARMELAEFYVRTGKRDAAKAVLTDMTTKDGGYLPAWRRQAEIALAEGHPDEAESKLQPVLKKNPSDIEGLLIRGRIHLAKRETTEAISAFQRVIKLEPKGGGDMSDVLMSLRAKPVNYNAHEQERVEEQLTVQGLDEEMLGAGLSTVLGSSARRRTHRRASVRLKLARELGGELRRKVKELRAK